KGAEHSSTKFSYRTLARSAALLGRSASWRSGGSRSGSRGREFCRERQISIVGRPVRDRKIVGGIEHRCPDVADVSVVHEEPLGQKIPELLHARPTQEDPHAEHDLLLYVYDRKAARGNQTDAEIGEVGCAVTAAAFAFSLRGILISARVGVGTGGVSPVL